MSSVFESGLVYGRFLAFAMLALIFSPVYTSAQDNYEIQVYGYDLVAPGHTMVELHSNFTIDGSKETSNGVYPTNLRNAMILRQLCAAAGFRGNSGFDLYPCQF